MFAFGDVVITNDGIELVVTGSITLRRNGQEVRFYIAYRHRQSGLYRASALKHAEFPEETYCLSEHSYDSPSNDF